MGAVARRERRKQISKAEQNSAFNHVYHFRADERIPEEKYMMDMITWFSENHGIGLRELLSHMFVTYAFDEAPPPPKSTEQASYRQLRLLMNQMAEMVAELKAAGLSGALIAQGVHMEEPTKGRKRKSNLNKKLVENIVTAVSEERTFDED